MDDENEQFCEMKTDELGSETDMGSTEEKHKGIIGESFSGTTIFEGKAEVRFPGEKNTVFYNPVQEFNRDLSIAVLREFALQHMKKCDSSIVDETFLKPGESFQKGLYILEALSASGLRSIRYAKEVGGIKEIVANDISVTAVESITANSKINEVLHLITPNEGDATLVMYQHKNSSKFNCIDIDPYGSPSPFIDAAVQSIADGGLLLVTATDMAILCGNVPETCYAKYASVSIKTKACHEMALRILLQFIQTSAARYGRYIHPLLSISVDFYIRVFVQVFTGKKECKSSASNLSMVYQCVGCYSLKWQPLMKVVDGKFSRVHGPPTTSECEFCHSRMNFGGPFYSQPIHDLNFVESLLANLDNPEFGELKTEKRIRGILNVISEELPDVPLYFGLDMAASVVKLSVPSLVMFRSAILNAGYRVSLSHCNPLSIKTDAPMSFIWDIFQEFAKIQHPDQVWPRSIANKTTLTPADRILSRTVATQVNFTVHPEANPSSRMQKLVRFQENPEKNWGPKTRAKANIRPKGDKRPGQKKPRLDVDAGLTN